MSKFILRTDEGPDFEVDTENRLASAEAYSGKTGKHIGHASLYRAGRNHLLYLVDKTKPEGKNRQGWVLNAQDMAEPLATLAIRVAGDKVVIKEVLRLAGFTGPEVLIDPAEAVVV